VIACEDGSLEIWAVYQAVTWAHSGGGGSGLAVAAAVVTVGPF
jgi:hypothetical protein